MQDSAGTPLERWRMCTKLEEPLILQQFLLFKETRSITQQLILQDLTERTNPFYDRTCNNEVLKMQKLGVLDAQLTSMQGTEYCLLHVQEPILYVIRSIFF